MHSGSAIMTPIRVPGFSEAIPEKFSAHKRKKGNFSISAGTAFWIPASAGMTQRISEVQHVIPAKAGIQAF